MANPARKIVNPSVNVPCEIQPGAFPGEFLVTIKLGDETVSGFVRGANYLTLRDQGAHSGPGYIKGTIIEQTESQTTIQLPGSYFTTASGIASVSSQWAKSNLQSLAA